MQETTIKSSCLTRMMASGQKAKTFKTNNNNNKTQIKWVAKHSLYKRKVETSASGDGVCAERVLFGRMIKGM